MIPSSPRFGRLFAGLLALTLGLLAVGWLTIGVAAQNPPKKEEEEDPAKPKLKAPPKVEEEDPTPTKQPPRKGEEVEDPRARPKKVIVVDDEVPGKPPPVARPADEAAPEIDDLLRRTKNAAVRELLRSASVPHDLVTAPPFSSGGTHYSVEPLTHYYPETNPKFPNGTLVAWPLDQDWKRMEKQREFGSRLPSRVRPFEEVVADDVSAFFARKFDELDSKDPQYLTRRDMLQAGEAALAAAERFHESAREKGPRQGPEWEPVGEKLRDTLFGVKMQLLAMTAVAGNWDATAAQAVRLAAAFPRPEQREAVAALLADLVKRRMDGELTHDKAKEARERLEEIERTFPGSAAAKPITARLRDIAQGHLDAAKALTNQPQKAAEELRMAAEVFPRLPGLSDQLHEVDRSYPILRVGVRELPREMLPGLATTDVERQVGELLFESLVRVRPQRDGGQRYEPVLASRLPRLVPLGRQFQLARGASWSNGEPVTAADVRATVLLLKDPKWPGHDPALAKLIEKAELGDTFLDLKLNQGFFDPLSLMTFKVLPAGVEKQPNQASKHPVGSGPYILKGELDEKTGKGLLFVASVSYGARANKERLPHIREIRFLQTADPVDALREGKVDLVADVPGPRVKELRATSGVLVDGPLTTRRVYFLAVNHRNPVLRDSPKLRRALALAIDRDKILTDYFRGDLGKTVHHALNGPFPVGSWACDPKNVPDLYQPGEAQALAKQAAERLGRDSITLHLKYPKDEPGVPAAMQYLSTSVANATGGIIKIELTPSDPYDLRKDVERLNDYDLAYYHLDHASEAYWLGPLFDPDSTDRGGSNYMGYTDGALTSLLEQAKNHRDFAKVQQATWLVHRKLYQDMPLIPLWQLDTFVARRREVQPAYVDPLLLFGDVERWEKSAK